MHECTEAVNANKKGLDCLLTRPQGRRAKQGDTGEYVAFCVWSLVNESKRALGEKFEDTAALSSSQGPNPPDNMQWEARLARWWGGFTSKGSSLPPVGVCFTAIQTNGGGYPSGLRRCKTASGASRGVCSGCS